MNLLNTTFGILCWDCSVTRILAYSWKHWPTKKFWEESLCRATSHWTSYATKVRPDVLNSISSSTIAASARQSTWTSWTLTHVVVSRPYTTHLLDVISRCVPFEALTRHILEALCSLKHVCPATSCWQSGLCARPRPLLRSRFPSQRSLAW